MNETKFNSDFIILKLLITEPIKSFKLKKIPTKQRLFKFIVKRQFKCKLYTSRTNKSFLNS